MALSFAIIVLSHPISQQSSLSAYQFTKAALASGHQIQQIFFYGNGTSHGNALTITPQDEVDVNQLWQELAKQHSISLNLCSGSALRRGILNEEEARRNKKAQSNLLPEFSLTGLGALAEAYNQADRVMVFGT